MEVVWFKRDLRVDDHLPLIKAASAGECLCLYIYEPELIHSDEFDTSHLEFINQALEELDLRLNEYGGGLTLRHGEAVEVVDRLHHERRISNLWSHEETGNKLTYDRDLRVSSWASNNGVTWNEVPQNGVIRRLKSRDGWAKQRDQFMREPPAEAPQKIRFAAGIDVGRILHAKELALPETTKSDMQIGGERQAFETLHSFLVSRGQNYSGEISSPVTAPNSCSRLSPYLAWGCISMKRVTHSLRERQQELKQAAPSSVSGWLKSLRAFESRLSWHCHFMQKLEDEPEIEFQNMCRAYDGLREDEFRQDYFEAWKHGRTGYPMVDACMRALHHHGWINFRMRAMLVSFASYHLWLHWRPTSVYLAQHFLDFEPGIHFSQFQMQSGTTGINTVRIYSPIKQVVDQDPTGQFIRSLLPELANVPEEHLAEPHKMPVSTQEKCGCIIGQHYPQPIVQHSVAYKKARDRIFEIRKRAAVKSQAADVAKKHGSRKGSTARTTRKRTKNKSTQKSLF